MKKIQVNPRNPNGFSAIELIAVLVLMSLITALALPVLSHSSPASQLTTAVQTINVSDSLARSHAKSHHTAVMMTVISNENLINLSSAADGWSKNATLPSKVLITGVTVNSESKTTASVSIPFSTSGWSAPYQIELSLATPSAAGEPTVLRFNSFTGQSNFQR